MPNAYAAERSDKKKWRAMQVIPGSQFFVPVHVAVLHQSVLQQRYFLLAQECRPQKKLKNAAYVARNSRI